MMKFVIGYVFTSESGKQFKSFVEISSTMETWQADVQRWQNSQLAAGAYRVAYVYYTENHRPVFVFVED